MMPDETPVGEMPLATVVTRRPEMPASISVPEAGVHLVAMPWWQIVLVRTGRVYLQSLLGFLTANLTGATEAVINVAAGTEINIPLDAFVPKLVVALSLAVAPAAFTLIQNIIEILARLDVVRPTLRA